MDTGIVKMYNSEKGFGFITCSNTGQDFFFHITGVKGDEPAENDKVEFNITEGKKGLQAIDVKKV